MLKVMNMLPNHSKTTSSDAKDTRNEHEGKRNISMIIGLTVPVIKDTTCSSMLSYMVSEAQVKQKFDH